MAQCAGLRAVVILLACGHKVGYLPLFYSCKMIKWHSKSLKTIGLVNPSAKVSTNAMMPHYANLPIPLSQPMLHHLSQIKWSTLRNSVDHCFCKTR